MKGIKRIFIALSAVLLTGCLAPENVLMTRVDMRAWNQYESITYENSDTISHRTLNIALRYNNNYKPTTLSLMVIVTTPDKRNFEEQVNLNLSHPKSATAITMTESLPYRDSVVLSQSGEYKFWFAPLSEVKGIEAVGIEIKN